MFINVKSATELYETLSTLKGGETILLAAGEYGNLEIKGSTNQRYHFDVPITITSASNLPEQQAIFTGLLLNNVEGVNIDGVTFKYDADAGAAINEKPAIIRNSENISIKESTFIGDQASGVDSLTDGYATGVGLHVTDSTSISISSNDFSQFYRGATFWRTDNLLVNGNHLHAMRSDGFNFADVDNVIIEGNHFESFVGSIASSDHRDFLQFWTSSTTSPSTDVIIRGNIFDIADGDWTQSIFIRNEKVDRGEAGFEMYYSEFVIEDNVIRNAHSHGITAGGIDGLTIRNNTIINNYGDLTSGKPPVIRVEEDSINVTITKNIAHSIFAPSSADVYDNLIIGLNDWDSLNKIFANPLDPKIPARDALLMTKFNGIEDNLGASMLYQAKNAESYAMIAYEAGDGIDMTNIDLSIDGILKNSDNIYNDQITQVRWILGDGEFEIGNNISHRYAASGSYNVTAEIKLITGEAITAHKVVYVDNPIAHFNKFEAESDLSYYKSDKLIELDPSGGVRLNNGTLNATADDRYFDNKAYTVSIDFKVDDNPDAGGRLINYTGSFHLQVKNGEVIAAIVTDRGVNWLNIDDLDIKSNAWHRLTLSFSSEIGVAQINLDGRQIGEIKGLEGAVQVGNRSQDFIIGDPNSGFLGSINNVVFIRDFLSTELLNSFIEKEVIMVDEESPHPLATSDVQVPEIYSEEIIASNVQELNSAINTASGGEIILLEGGVYDRIVLRNKFDIDDHITIRSSDPNDPAIISFLFVENTKNVVFDSVFLGGSEEGKFPVQLHNSSEIYFKNTFFLDRDQYDNSVGLIIKNSHSIYVNDSVFDGYDRSILVGSSHDINITSSSFAGNSRDSITFVGSDNIQVASNYFGRIDAHKDISLIRFDDPNYTDTAGKISITDNIIDVTAQENKVRFIDVNDSEYFDFSTIVSERNVNISELDGHPCEQDRVNFGELSYFADQKENYLYNDPVQNCLDNEISFSDIYLEDVVG